MKLLFINESKNIKEDILNYLKSQDIEIDQYPSFTDLNKYDLLLIDTSINNDLIKEAYKIGLPIISIFNNVDKNKYKEVYKNIYKYVNAIIYKNIDEQNNFEQVIKRRTNGHNLSLIDKEKLLFLIKQYSSSINHSTKKKYYYSDLLKDDFAFNKIEVIKDKSVFKYVHKNIFWKCGEFILYNIIARPIIYLINQITYHQKIVNKKALKKCKNKGYFIYGNHTIAMGDAYTPNLLTTKRNYIIVSRETVSIKGIKQIVTMLGAIPVYDKIDEVNDFNNCIKKRIEQHRSITIYPEAHIWPYYTKIRPYKKDSFRYPVDLNAPSFSLTTTYQKRKIGKGIRRVSYISGPFYPNKELSRPEAMQDLRDRIYEEMNRISSSVEQEEKALYIKIEK